MCRISQAARLLGVTPKTLRVWEQEGRIHPIRTPGNQRRYPQTEIERLVGVVRPEEPRSFPVSRLGRTIPVRAILWHEARFRLHPLVG